MSDRSQISLSASDLSQSVLADLSVYEPPEDGFDSSSLSSFSEGDRVTYGDEKVGVVVAKLTESFDWPGAEGDVEASSDEPYYIVARESGGSKPFSASELEPHDGSFTNEDPDPSALADDASLADIYWRTEKPDDLDEFHDAYDELASIPGVDDPGTGFDSWPDSWEDAEKPARLIALDAWASMGGTWTGCYREIGSKRVCSAFKDEILGTENWRNKF